MALMLVRDESDAVPTTFGSRALDALFGLILLTFPAVGALIVSQRPRNPIGWMFSVIGLTWAVSGFAHEYAAYSLVEHSGTLPADEVFGWLQSWLFFPGLFIVPSFFCLLFPDGRLLSPRWLPVAWLAVPSIAFASIGSWLEPGPLEGLPTMDNPLAASACSSPRCAWRRLWAF
jgi:hypothetical protein